MAANDRCPECGGRPTVWKAPDDSGDGWALVDSYPDHFRDLGDGEVWACDSCDFEWRHYCHRWGREWAAVAYMAKQRRAQRMLRQAANLLETERNAYRSAAQRVAEALQQVQLDLRPVDKNTDPYGAAALAYADAWADLMEAQLEAGEKLEQIAGPTSREADTAGITGFMYSIAVMMLSEWWEHGDALRRWHNLRVQVRDEGERANENGTVLNSAILEVSS